MIFTISIFIISLLNNLLTFCNTQSEENFIFPDVSCGQRLNNISQPLIVNGRNAKYGEFPWHVGIYIKEVETDFPNYICGGSIISQNSILTVAHCFTDDNGNEFKGVEYFVAAGKYYSDYLSPFDPLAQKRKVLKVEIHPKYKGILSNYAWDIAVATINETFEFSDIVQPVCVDLSSEFETEQLVFNNKGEVAGWGFTEENLKNSSNLNESDELQVLSVPFIDQDKCIEALPKSFLAYLTPDKFCAGYRNGSSVCIGDSGSGLVFAKTYQKETRYYIRGLVSVGVQKKNNCDNHKYSTYTKVSSYLPFIQDYVQNSCTTPNGEIGRCISLYKCKTFLDILINKSATAENYQFITNSSCGYSDQPLVCCGTSVKYKNGTNPSPIIITNPKRFHHKNLKLLPSRCKCGRQSYQYNTIGSFIAGLEEYPWVARIKFENDDQTFDTLCYGVLINERYVLTGARCIAGFEGNKSRAIRYVRLGEYDLNEDTDCLNTTNLFGQKVKQCSDLPLNLQAEKVVIHPQFLKPHSKILQNDIALIRLSQKVQFTKFIRPICLPLNGETTKIGEFLNFASWPWFFYSELPSNYSKLLNQVKLKAKVPVLNFHECLANYLYDEESNRDASPSQICGGGIEGIDVCGSTGAALINNLPNKTAFYVEGIVSFGRLCGAKDVPSVFTRVSKYLDWILDNIEP